MQFRLASALLIFLGSYFPLAVILAVQDIPIEWWRRPICTYQHFVADKCEFLPFSNPWMSIVFVALTTLAVSSTTLSLAKIRFPFTVEVRSAKAIPNDLINYSFPYVVSFAGISYADTPKLLGYAIFLAWMFVISYKSGQILMNPLLIVFNWRLYEAEIIINGSNRLVRILKRGALYPGTQSAQTVQDLYITRD